MEKYDKFYKKEDPKIKSDEGQKKVEAQISDDAATPKTHHSKKEPVFVKVVSGTRLNLREEANINSKVLCIMESGETMTLEESLDAWSRVTTSKEIEGYVMTEFIEGV